MKPDVLTTALAECRRAFWSVGLVSCATNLLMFAGPIYMLQVYDRVIPGRSIPTLVGLTLMLLAAFAFQGFLDAVRNRIVIRIGRLLDERLAGPIHGAVILLARQNRPPGESGQPLRDLDMIRAFLSGPGPAAIFDMPWILVFVAVCFLIHPLIGTAAIFSALLLIGLTVLTELTGRDGQRETMRVTAGRHALIEAARLNATSVKALGMTTALRERWLTVNRRYLYAMQRTSDTIGGFASASRTLRMLIQSLVLGLGAYLVVIGDMTAGSVIACSIMIGRALSPVESAIGSWNGFTNARQAIDRLRRLFGAIQAPGETTELPAPTRSLTVENLVVAAPGAMGALLQQIAFGLNAGEALGIIGPSAAGKSSLARVLVGAWPAARGAVRLDGALIDHWEPVALARHVDYLPQEVSLFDGTIAENIARMAVEPDSAAVVAAAKAAGAHEMVLRLPGGYDTVIGEGGVTLSGGQRQRVALARALYGDPFFVVLDEPNANLDREGEAALTQAILSVKTRGGIVIAIAHRPAAVVVCDHVLYLGQGTQLAFGPRDEVLRKILAPAPAAGDIRPAERRSEVA
ncbi:PrtD family type I secretion system ABC transporter [Bosea sp. OAE506]|uniref:type I secretion system permease/ATPase n=1 Tax=Bosea sp. OAE506 TaxID=2663870 RepID=UPI00178B3C59